MWNACVVSEVGESSSFSSRQSGRHTNVVGPSHVVLPSYFDCGDPVHMCGYCSALFWYDERVLRLSRRGNFAYSKCCRSGAVVLPSPLEPPFSIMSLYQDRHFFENIRAYNAMFSMTSFGAKIDNTINTGQGPYTFKVSGQVSHWIGSLCPQTSEKPRFLQLYIYDVDNEVSNRLEFFRQYDRSVCLRPHIVSILSEALATHNEYVRTFRVASEIASQGNLTEYAVRLYNNEKDGRYGAPAPGTLGGIVVADDPNASQYDIIVRSKYGPPHHISYLHRSYMPLQYPLLFPFGQNGWSSSLRLTGRGIDGSKALTVNMFYSHLIHDRYNVYTLLLNGGRLFQQFLVDAYLCVEQGRLEYIRNHQTQLRSEYVSGVYDAVSKGDSQGRSIGKRLLLPSSFVGGPRYMYKHYQDALALCRVYGNPQYFITFTCNAKWPEIIRFMDSNSMGQPQNRPDIIARVFQMKVVHFIKFLKEDKTFGDVVGYLYTIEFQKRGLPHCHTLLWVSSPSKVVNPADVDRYITAELPDPQKDSRLYSIVTTCMLHGPCGLANVTASCMRNGECKKRFPKPFCESTFFDKDSYAHYRRRPSASHFLRSGIEMHNGFVVPYNKRLCSRFDAHINVEYCGWNMLIKYLFKYISKGLERVSFTLHCVDASGGGNSQRDVAGVDEIANFVDGRFICSHEASWRLLNFPIHERHPAVQILAVHLEGFQSTTFEDRCVLETLIKQPGFGNTTLTRWLVNNRDGRGLTYVEYTTLYRWDNSLKDWVYRIRGSVPAVGRLVYVHPTSGELFYLRLLLCHQKGCRTFSEIRTVNGVTYASFRLACEALGLIGDDREWMTAFIEASEWASSAELRSLFCHLLLFCEVSNPISLWECGWSKMGDDIVRNLRSAASSSVFEISDDILREYILVELERLLNGATPSKSLSDFHLPLPSQGFLNVLGNRMIWEETMFDTIQLQQQHIQMVNMLNPDQLRVYNRIRDDQAVNKQTLLFVYGHGGTGKTFLWSTILAYFRSIRKIVLAVAASGIASLLLPNGRTAHSRFNIPIDITDNSICNIKKKTQLAELLKATSMVIWDEATMTERRCFECVDRTFRDILGKKDVLFGGMSMLLGGDFRQTLPVKRKQGNHQILALTLPNSYLWPHFNVYKLMHNMRISADLSDQLTVSASARFASWLLDVGNGLVGSPDPVQPQSASFFQIPERYLILDEREPLKELVTFVYSPEILLNPSIEALCSRAIVCPKNVTTEEINSMILNMGSTEIVSYYSNDSVVSHGREMSDLEVLYPEEYLNTLNFPGFPLHCLRLKKNVLILLLRNLNQKDGLCNGTRLLVRRLLPSLIEVVIMTGTSIGKRVHLPRIKLIYKDPELPFVVVRKQFPCRLCYTMTINKSQGQSLNRVGIYLPIPVFSHGQLYVALSRATSPDSMTKIADLKHGCLGESIRIRILRKWIPHYRKHETWYLAVDESGDAIAVLGQNAGQKYLESMLQLLRCYEIESYSCSETPRHQRKT